MCVGHCGVGQGQKKGLGGREGGRLGSNFKLFSMYVKRPTRPPLKWVGLIDNTTSILLWVLVVVVIVVRVGGALFWFESIFYLHHSYGAAKTLGNFCHSSFSWVMQPNTQHLRMGRGMGDPESKSNLEKKN